MRMASRHSVCVMLSGTRSMNSSEWMHCTKFAGMGEEGGKEKQLARWNGCWDSEMEEVSAGSEVRENVLEDIMAIFFCTRVCKLSRSKELPLAPVDVVEPEEDTELSGVIPTSLIVSSNMSWN